MIPPHFTTRRNCPGCGSNHTYTLFARPYAEPALRRALETFYAEVGRLDYEALLGADYVVQACPGCSLVFQRDIPDDLLLEKLYAEWISSGKSFERFHAHVSEARQREMARKLALSLSLSESSDSRPQVLDYGCGWGEWGRAALAAGAECWGTELSHTRREACVRAGIRVVSETELPPNTFDVINADQVLEHLPAPAATLALLKAKLRPGGVIRFAVPNGWNVESALRRFDRELRRPRLGGLNPIAPLEHLNCFTARSLARLAESAGLIRVIPPRRMLLRSMLWLPGLRAKVKQLVLPVYLRSNWSTQMWFAHPPRSTA